MIYEGLHSNVFILFDIMSKKIQSQKIITKSFIGQI